MDFSEIMKRVKAQNEQKRSEIDEVSRRTKQEAAHLQCLHEIYERRRQREAIRNPSLKAIPCFFHKRPPAAPPDEQGSKSVAAKLRDLSKQRFLEKMEKQILDEYEVEQVEGLLQSGRFDSEPRGGRENEYRMNYEHFCELKELLPPKTKQHFTGKNFLSLPPDKYGRINHMDFLEKLCQTNELNKTRISLYHYDTEGKGNLKETDLEMYIYDTIANIPILTKMHENFVPYYVFTAVRRFMFFLDPKKTWKINIERLVTSSVMYEFQELKRSHDNLPPAMQRKMDQNWFSLQNAMSVYSMYLNLDEDENGMLNKRELIRYEGRRLGSPAKLTEAFVNRVFEEIVTYKMNPEDDEPEMDYKIFLDFALAMENKTTTQALQYFWKMLDVQKTGYMTSFTINYFFRDILDGLRQSNLELSDVADVRDEIFDMVKPKDPTRITLEDLCESNVGHTIVSMLIDVNGFWAYDNRENMGHDDEDEEEDDDPMAYQNSMWNEDQENF